MIPKHITFQLHRWHIDGIQRSDRIHRQHLMYVWFIQLIGSLKIIELVKCTLIYVSSILKQAISDYVNHARIRCLIQPTLCNEDNISYQRKQRVALMKLELTNYNNSNNTKNKNNKKILYFKRPLSWQVNLPIGPKTK